LGGGRGRGSQRAEPVEEGEKKKKKKKREEEE